MIRRLKKDVLNQLPTKTRIRVEIPVDSRYQKELSDLLRNNDQYIKYMNDPQKAKLLEELDKEFNDIKPDKKISIMKSKKSKKKNSNNSESNSINSSESTPDKSDDRLLINSLKIKKARNMEGKLEDPNYFFKAYSLKGGTKVDGIISYVKDFLEKCKVFSFNSS